MCCLKWYFLFEAVLNYTCNRWSPSHSFSGVSLDLQLYLTCNISEIHCIANVFQPNVLLSNPFSRSSLSFSLFAANFSCPYQSKASDGSQNSCLIVLPTFCYEVHHSLKLGTELKKQGSTTNFDIYLYRLLIIWMFDRLYSYLQMGFAQTNERLLYHISRITKLYN